MFLQTQWVRPNMLMHTKWVWSDWVMLISVLTTTHARPRPTSVYNRIAFKTREITLPKFTCIVHESHHAMLITEYLFENKPHLRANKRINELIKMQLNHTFRLSAHVSECHAAFSRPTWYSCNIFTKKPPNAYG